MKQLRYIAGAFMLKILQDFEKHITVADSKSRKFTKKLDIRGKYYKKSRRSGARKMLIMQWTVLNTLW
jgi:hypothetical protein